MLRLQALEKSRQSELAWPTGGNYLILNVDCVSKSEDHHGVMMARSLVGWRLPARHFTLAPGENETNPIRPRRVSAQQVQLPSVEVEVNKMEESRHIDSGSGEAEGASSDSEPSGHEPSEDRSEEGPGDIEIPIGVPVSSEEFRRLKEDARRPENREPESDTDAVQSDLEDRDQD